MLPFFRKAAEWAGLTTTRCPVCGRLTGVGDLCSQCAEAIRPRTGGYCPQCGDVFGEEDTRPIICGACRTEPPPWDRLHFYNIHAGTLRDLILSYKFNNGIGRTRLLSTLAVEAFFKEEARTPDAIIPVPLHTKRLLWRGYNQSTEIALFLGKKLDKPVLKNGLLRTRNTRPQTSLSAADRQENIKGAFEAEANEIRGKTILVVDDVYTTGATLKECAKTLKRSGAAGVDVLVLAKALQ